ncbi:hypothetical protein Pfo_005108 [Paulownia fortunei]|nr:hypothetical protein Pfo_005108 [Paulownia fortunei]
MGVCKSRDMIPGCGSVDQYESLNVISHGAYDIVYRARDKKTGEIVAMTEEFDGLSISSLMEIDILKSLHSHPSIVGFKQVAVNNYDGVYVVMEYLENDLKRYIDCLMKQSLEGVKFLHNNRVMHSVAINELNKKDLKPSNILMNNILRSMLELYSPRVVTLWYRARELLLGAKRIHLKSISLFRDGSELGQPDKIYRILSTPDEAVWPGFSSLPGGRAKFVNNLTICFETSFMLLQVLQEPQSLQNLNLICSTSFWLTILAKRVTAQAALNHGWFKEILVPNKKN